MFLFMVCSLIPNLRRLPFLLILDACPLFVMSVDLLEDKQTFKHGGVITVIYAWIKWVFRTHSWGLICFILCLRPYFSYYVCFG